MNAELPLNEIMRIKKLHDLAILDTPREQSFDDVAQVAMQVCDVPIAVVSMVDINRQWFKSCLGLEATETPRDIAFCAHAILNPSDVLIVEDATKDPRFADNPLVSGEPYIRFYAGAPLLTEDGFALGTLCVVDYKARTLNEGQLNALKALARQTMQLLRLKTTHDAMQQYSAKLQIIADNAPVLIGEINPQHRYSFNNKKYHEWINHDVRNVIGKTPAEIYPPDTLPIIESAITAGFDGKSIHVEISLKNDVVLDINYLPHIENNIVVGVYEVGTDVTERKIQSQIIQQERERLAAIIEGTNIGTWEWNVQTGEVIFNDRWANMLGYTLAELEPVNIETWRRLMHPDDLVIATAELEKHFRGDTVFFDCEFRMRRKNNEWQWIHSRGKVGARTTQGNPLLMSGKHADISIVKNAFKRLEDSEDLLRSLLSNFPGAAYRCENNCTRDIHYLSDAVFQLTGYSAKEFLGEANINFERITHPDDIETRAQKIQLALQQHISFMLEYRIKHADGSLRHVQESGCGVYDEKGELRFIDGFIWDITERHTAEKAKKVIDNKMDSLYQLAPVGIALNRLSDGKFIDANPEIFRMTGYPEEEFKNLHYWDITPKEYAAEEARQLDLLKTTGRYGPYEKHYMHKDGHLIPVLLNGVVIEGQTGEQEIWSIIQDITAQKHMEKMKSEFISTVSHELRTPLTSISGSLGLITNNMLGVIPEKVQSVLNIAYKNSQRLTLLINDLLDMEKLLAGKMFFDMKEQPLAPLLEQAVTENKFYAEKHAVTYVITDSFPGVKISIDAFRLQQVLNNFLSNAAKYSHHGGQVDIHLEQFGHRARITVQDYGTGIPEEFKSRIFQKFSQADSSDTRQKGGTGLGLAISKELVERMGGTLGFESEPGQGSRFFAEFDAFSNA